MRAKFFLMVILLFWCCEVAAQIQLYDTNFKLSRKNFVIKVPIEIVHNQVFLPLVINGQSYRFKLDTGASQGVIYDDLIFDGVKQLGYIKSEDATGRMREVRTVELPSFMIETLQIKGYKVQLMHRNVVRKGEDGIIGFALFNKGIAAIIDVRNSQMILTDRKKYFNNEEGESLNYHLKKHVPVIKISPFENAEEDVLFDSGSPLFYAINNQKYKELESQNPTITEQVEGVSYGSQIRGHFGREPSGKITMLNLKRLKWGNYVFCDLRCSTITGGSHLGAKLLDYGKVIINPYKKKLIFQPYNGKDSCIVENSQNVIEIVERNGKAMVGMIIEQSKAWDAGFRYGCIIEKVNGQPINFEQFFNFGWIKNQKYQFTISLPLNIQSTFRALWPLQYNE